MLGHNHQYMINPSDKMISQCIEAKQLSYPPMWPQQGPITISLTRVMLEGIPNKRWLITKPDKVPHNAPAQSEAQKARQAIPGFNKKTP